MMLIGGVLFGIVGIGVVIGGALLAASVAVLAVAIVLRGIELALGALGAQAPSERAAAMRRRVLAVLPASAPMPQRKGMPCAPPM